MLNNESVSLDAVSSVHISDSLQKSLQSEMKKFTELLSLYNIQIKIDSPEAIRAWNLLSESKKIESLNAFSAYRKACTEIHLSGVSLRDNYGLLNRFLRRSNLHSRNDISTIIHADTMVEIYSAENVQLFRSINFFDYCNYSLLDLIAIEWFVLYERHALITESILKQVQQAISGEQLSRFTIPAHVMKERTSRPRGVFHIDLQYCSPLYSPTGEFGGFMVTLNVNEICVIAEDSDNSQNNLTFLV